MKFAVIDIGSNAIRLQVSNTLVSKGLLTFKKIEYVRFPLRLGYDVFTTGAISNLNRKKFLKLMESYMILIGLYEVNDYIVCATSAMREAENGREIAHEVEQKIGMKIHLIDGKKEAQLITNAINVYLSDKSCLHIDVGGGSTELSLYNHGEQIASSSFKIGSVRRLNHKESPIIWKRMKRWIESTIKKEYHPLQVIGTGGNIVKLHELGGRKMGKTISLDKLREVQGMVAGLSIEERINDLQLNPDRADVIIPASEIYLTVMEWAKAKSVLVPDVGLKDGMLLHLYKKHSTRKT